MGTDLVAPIISLIFVHKRLGRECQIAWALTLPSSANLWLIYIVVCQSMQVDQIKIYYVKIKCANWRF